MEKRRIRILQHVLFTLGDGLILYGFHFLMRVDPVTGTSVLVVRQRLILCGAGNYPNIAQNTLLFLIRPCPMRALALASQYMASRPHQYHAQHTNMIEDPLSGHTWLVRIQLMF